MRSYFDPNIHISTVTIVGIGGTGSQVARIVGRILYDMKRSRLHTPDLVLIDPDRVEPHNVGRQLFAASDIGLYKAEVVSRRLNFGLGLSTSYIPELVNADKHFEHQGSNLVISCVDNHEARKEIHNIDCVLIGAGNHHDSGQVTIGNCGEMETIKRHIDGRDGKYLYLPKEGILFPQLLEPEPEQPTQAVDASCAELVASGDQHLLINDVMATVVGQYVYKLLHRQPIYGFLTYVSIGETQTMRSLPVCREELTVYLRASAPLL